MLTKENLMNYIVISIINRPHDIREELVCEYMGSFETKDEAQKFIKLSEESIDKAREEYFDYKELCKKLLFKEDTETLQEKAKEYNANFSRFIDSSQLKDYLVIFLLRVFLYDLPCANTQNFKKGFKYFNVGPKPPFVYPKEFYCINCDKNLYVTLSETNTRCKIPTNKISGLYDGGIKLPNVGCTIYLKDKIKLNVKENLKDISQEIENQGLKVEILT